MIKNERQYWIAKSRVERFESTLAELSGCKVDDGVHPLLAKAREDATRSRLSDLKADIREYEALKAGKFDMDKLAVVSILPDMLIKARVALGMTQRDLAERIGLKEQQIQRYEATDYATASLSRIRDVVGGLRVKDMSLISLSSETDTLFKSLEAAFPRIVDSKKDFRFEVRPKASIYIRRDERDRGEHCARIRRDYIHNFPNSDELKGYIDDNRIELDPPKRDYKIGPEHIEAVIAILAR